VHALNKCLSPVVLNLPRDCRATDDVTGELLIRGRRGKGFDCSPLSEGARDPDRPWVVAAPVHTAISLLEDLSDSPFLFPASTVCAHRLRPADVNARTHHAMNSDVGDFISWVNTTFATPGTGDPIPPDPSGHIYGTRFRRIFSA
jgi:hypothetical protein